MPYTTYLNTKLNKEAFGAITFTAPATVYVGLSTTTPTQASTGVTEPASGAYARVAVNNTTGWTPSGTQPGDGGQQQENVGTITFPTATGSWGTVTYFVIYDASSGGNLMAFDLLGTPTSIVSGDIIRFSAGALKIKLD